MRVHIQAAAAISFLSIVISSFGQVVLFNEDFESDGFPLRYILSSHFNDLPNNTIFDVTTDAGHPYGGGTYTDYKGFGFFAAEDTDDAAGDQSDTQTITFPSISIIGHTGLQFDALFAAGAIPLTYDIDDFISVEVQVDGGGFVQILRFESTNAVVGNFPMAEDTDFDFIGDGAPLGLGFQRFTKLLGTTGVALDVRVSIKADSGFESMALDDVNIIAAGAGPPEIDVHDGALVSDPSLTNGAAANDFGATSVTVGAIERHYNIDNTAGLDALNLSSVSFVGGHAGDFSLVGAYPETILGGVSEPITVRFDPSGLGTRSTTLRIMSDDADEAVYDISLRGIGNNAAPEISLHDGASPTDPVIVHGGLAAIFGGALVLGETIDRTFNIDNSAGTAPLTISGIAVTAGHVADFNTVGAVPGAIPAGASGTFVLRFDPTAAGTRGATVTIFSDDADEGSYEIHVSGRGLEGPFLLCEDFEDDGHGSRYFLSTQFFDLTNGIMDQTTNLTHAEDGEYTGLVNTGIFAAEDTDDAAGNGLAEQTLTFSVPIFGESNLVFSGRFAAGASSTYDVDDHMFVQVSIDSGPLLTLLQMESTSSSVDNQPLALDSNFDGRGDGRVLGLAFQEFSAAIPGSGTTLNLTVKIHADSGNESMALDFLKIVSVPDNVYQAYDQWTHDAGLVGDDASFSDDPDGDGGKNGYEWATGSIPSNANSIVYLDLGETNAYGQVVFTRNTDATELTLVVQCSTNLTDPDAWVGLATNILGVWTPPAVVNESGSGNPVDVTVSIPSTATPAAFYRLHVSQP